MISDKLNKNIRLKRKIIRWMKIIFLLYCIVGTALFFLQKKILFHPKALPKEYQYSFNVPFKEINIDISKTENLNIIQFNSKDSVHKGAVLYFHGNMENINHYARFADIFTKNGYIVYMVDYPGFGKTTGELTEQKVYGEAMQVYKLANKSFSSDSLIIYGRSLGTGIASQLATRVNCRRLILETPYSSIPDLFSSFAPIYPSELMSEFKFPVKEYLKEIKVPVTIFHGDKDEIIPYKCALKLKEVLKVGDEFITVPHGKHNNLFQFKIVTNKIDSLLN